MNYENGRGFHFGLESEYLLVDVATFRSLWFRDLSFARLNEALESISLDDLPPLDGLDLEPPHRKLMPFAVEGYHVPDPDMNPIDLWPKGIEIRTPVCASIEICLECLQVLHQRLQAALERLGYQAVALSHHPTEDQFEASQNKRRYDFWQWAMQAMRTYGPDVNISLPAHLNAVLDVEDLHAKANYYAPRADRSEPCITVPPGGTVANPRPCGQIHSHLPAERGCPGNRTPSRGGRPAGIQDLRDDLSLG